MENKKIVYGRNTTLEYIKQLDNPSGAELFISKTAHGKIIDFIIKESQRKEIPIEYCEKSYLTRFNSSSNHQGVVLVLPRKKKATNDQEFIENILHNKGVLVLLDQLTDPQNVGSIIRTTEALGGDGVVISKSHSSNITSVVVKASAGATVYLRILTVSNIANFLENAKKMGFWIIGTSDKGDSDLTRLRGLRPSIIIIGNEGSGMRRLTKEKCDLIVQIPLKGNMTSLNASVAAGIVLYEALIE
ncbi:MAG: 23S rRNA (guanosine(2251)-2'-O)-methyltransferase RlmB [Spirochaetota bacterium]|nr:23S rRNA (guanosine(2251)-2'-O)-methyltransferase RlmB [Spirochaetota bacterium]